MSEQTLRPPFQLGQEVFLARASSYSEVMVPCPICFGKLCVTLILGNGEEQPIECDYCGKGYDGPQGVVREYRPVSSVERRMVTGLETDGENWSFHLSGSGYCTTKDRQLFATAEEAEVRRLELHEEAKQDAERRMESILKGKKKSFTWTVGYHRSQIRDMESRIEWHKKRLCQLIEKREKKAPKPPCESREERGKE